MTPARIKLFISLCLSAVCFAAPLAVFLRALPDMLWPVRQIVDTEDHPQPVQEREVVLD